MRKYQSLTTFAWLTHDRPEALRRSVQSFVQGTGESSVDYKYIIAVSGSSQSYPSYIKSKKIIFANDNFRNDLILYLEKKIDGYSNKALRFALDANQPEGTEGAHRNLISLLTQGELVACSDDDIVFDIRSLPDKSKLRKNVGQRNFIPLNGYDELSSFEEAATRVSVPEFIKKHEQALQEASFSSPGIRGDSAYGGPRFIFTFNESELVDMCKEKCFIDKALASRVMWRETYESHLVHYESVATYMLGLNGSKGLAPCFPFGRNVDGAFVYATKALYPQSKTAHLNASVLHLPVVDRGTYSSLKELELRVNDVIWLMWSEWLRLNPSTGCGDRHQLAFSYFKNLTHLDTYSFSDYLQGLIERSLLDRAQSLEIMVNRLSSNPSQGLSVWCAHAENEIALCRKIAREGEFPVLVEAKRPGRSAEESLRVTQEWLKLYAEILELWPILKELVQQRYVDNQFINQNSVI